MKKSGLILSLAAVLALWACWSLWRFDQERSGAGFLASARAHLEAVPPDYGRVVRELQRALELARAEEDPALVEEILRLRADVHYRNRSLDPSLADYDELLRSFAPEDVDLVRSASRISLEAGHTERALALSTRWTELQPRNGGGWAQRGEVRQVQAQQALAALEDALVLRLDSLDAEQASEALRRLVYLPEGSSLRAGPERAWTALRSPAELEAWLPRLAQAAELVALARADYLESLRVGPSSGALAALQGLLRRAGRLEEAWTLGTLGLAIPALSQRHDVLAETAVELFLDGRPARAGAAWRAGTAALSYELSLGSIQAELNLHVPALLLRIGEHEALIEGEASLNWSRRRIEAPEVDLTHARARLFLQQGRDEEALAALRRIRPDDPEPYPGANLAACLLEQELVKGTPGALPRVWGTLTRLAGEVGPGDPLAPKVADAWRGLAAHSSGGPDPTRSQVCLGRALALAGEEPALVAAWEEEGRRAMAERGYELASIVASLRADSRVLGTGGYLPWEVLEAARAFHSSGEYGTARSALAWLFRLLPDLPQALVLAGRCELAVGDAARAAELWTRRVEIGGPGSEEALAELSRFPWDTLAGPTRLRLLRAAPLVFGPFVRLRNLARSGREAEAIAWLERRDLTVLGEAMRVEAARLYASTGQWGKVRGVLCELPLASPATSETAGLLLRALVRTPSGVEQELLARVAQARGEDPDLLLAVDDLIADGRVLEAEAVLAGLIERPALRTPALVERTLALRLALSGSVAEELGERRAWVQDSGARLLSLAAAVDAGVPEEIEHEAAELALLPLGRPPLARALVRLVAGAAAEAELDLLGIEGTTFGAAELRRGLALELVAALESGPSDAAAADLPDYERFLTFLATALLSLERPSVVPWTLQRLRALPPVLRDDPRVALLEALSLSALGAGDRAEALAVRLSEDGVPGAWLLREDLARERQGEGSPAFAKLFAQRMEAIGARGLPPDAVALHEARRTALAGNDARALGVLDLALAALPDAPSLLQERARLLARSAQPLRALDDYHRLLDLLPPDRAAELVPEYLDLLHAARADGTLTRGALRSWVEALSIVLPGEPLAVGELALLAAADGRSADLGRAWEVMEAYLRRTGGVLERSRPGEARRWLELFLRVDPERAVRFAGDQLARHPESPEAWRDWVATLRAARRHERAFDALSLFARFHPEPDVLALVPIYAADAGLSAEELRLTVQRTREGLQLASPPGAAVPDPSWVLALHDHERFEPLDAEDLDALARAWEESASGVPHGLRRRLAAAYARALRAQEDAAGRERAKAVAEELAAEAHDALDRHVDEVLATILAR